MSYLPRMSKTYKEPPPIQEEPEEDIMTTLKPASSLLNEKTYNPLMVLKHYRYLPHALPVLPGPSLLEEVLENELSREANRMRRSASKMESFTKASEIISEQPLGEENEEISENKAEETERVKRIHSKKTVKGSKNLLGKRKSNKAIKKGNTSNTLISMCLVETDKPFTATEGERKFKDEINNPEFLSKDELESLKKEKSVLPICNDNLVKKTPKITFMQLLKEEKLKVQPKRFKDRSVQCTIFGSTSKLFVIPLVINSLLRTLAFLLHETNKEEIFNNISGDKKILMTQIQIILNDLCNQKIEKEFGFETTYSDYKRLDIIFGEFKKYLKSAYGDKGEYMEKMEDFKKVFIELKKKEMELVVLIEKIQELEDVKKVVIMKEDDLKNPEITLQNKRLENEQLSAEVEFGRIEIRKCQNAIAELDWDIRHFQGQVSNLKKSAASRSKTEMLGRKSSSHKFSSEILMKGSRSKESESSYKKKTS